MTMLAEKLELGNGERFQADDTTTPSSSIRQFGTTPVRVSFLADCGVCSIFSTIHPRSFNALLTVSCHGGMALEGLEFLKAWCKEVVWHGRWLTMVVCSIIVSLYVDGSLTSGYRSLVHPNPADTTLPAPNTCQGPVQCAASSAAAAVPRLLRHSSPLFVPAS